MCCYLHVPQPVILETLVWQIRQAIYTEQIGPWILIWQNRHFTMFNVHLYITSRCAVSDVYGTKQMCIWTGLVWLGVVGGGGLGW